MTATVGQILSNTSTEDRSIAEKLAAVIARDIPAGPYVNLGIGQPAVVADHLAAEAGVVLHTENGMLGMGRPGQAAPTSIPT